MDKIDFNGSEVSRRIAGIQAEWFDDVALDLFEYQYSNNKLYREYCDYLRKTPSQINRIADIPFLPIEFFKSHEIKTGSWKNETVFTSSGTTGSTVSKHLVKELHDYRFLSELIFKQFYGPLSEYTILALLPSYLEREGSSLIEMVNYFIKETGDELSGFFLNEYDEIVKRYKKADERGKKVILWGVSFALLDFSEHLTYGLPGVTVIETGGMKGRRKEMTREELHKILQGRLHTDRIQSEYGMTELMSQAYSQKDGVFKSPQWMKVVCREINDPLSILGHDRTGGINVIDLGNWNTCSFIATQDLGKSHENGTFQITGRLDNSDIRGCNLMIN